MKLEVLFNELLSVATGANAMILDANDMLTARTLNVKTQQKTQNQEVCPLYIKDYLWPVFTQICTLLNDCVPSTLCNCLYNNIEAGDNFGQWN